MNIISIDNSRMCAKNRYQHFLQFVDILMLIVLLTLGMTSNIVTLIIVTSISISFLWKTPSNVVSSMLFYYPFYCIFKFNGVGISYYNIIIVVAIVCLIFKKDKNYMGLDGIKIHIPPNVFGVIVFTLWCVCSSFLNDDNSIVSIAIDICIPLILVTCVANQNDLELERVFYAFSVGCIVAGLAGLDIISLPNLDLYIDMLGYRIGNIRLIRLQGLTVNPNYYSLDLNMAICALLCVGKMQNRKMKNIEIVMIVILTVLGFMTLSKSFILGLVCTVFIYIFIIGNLRQFGIVLTVGLVSALFVIYLYTQGNAYVTAIFGRFLEADSMEGLTSSRSEIWVAYLREFFLYPSCFLVGRGINASPPALVGEVSHNLYLEVIYYVGIIGGMFLLLMFLNLLKRKKRKKIQYLPLGVFLVRAFAINLFVREAFMIDLIIIILILNSVIDESNSKKCSEESKNVLRE